MVTIVNSKIVIGPYFSDIFWIQVELSESKKAVIVVYHFRKIVCLKKLSCLLDKRFWLMLFWAQCSFVKPITFPSFAKIFFAKIFFGTKVTPEHRFILNLKKMILPIIKKIKNKLFQTSWVQTFIWKNKNMGLKKWCQLGINLELKEKCIKTTCEVITWR